MSMKNLLAVGLCTALLSAAPASLLAQDPGATAAPAPASPAPAAAAPAAEAAPKKDPLKTMKDYLLNRPKDGPSRLERLLVASGAGMVSVVALGVGLGFGVWALLDYQCLRNIQSCNDGRSEGSKITGANFLKARQTGERKALAADMGYLMAGTFALVAVLGLAAAFWPSGWWPFSVEDVVEAAPSQVVTEMAPAAQPAPEAQPAAAPPAETPAPAPQPAPQGGAS